MPLRKTSEAAFSIDDACLARPAKRGEGRCSTSSLTQGWMQVAMKKDVIRRKAIEPKSHVDESDARAGGVQSVDRALSIIETLAEDDGGYRLSDLAIRTGLSTSTVHRLLGTLENRRCVQFDRTGSKWHGGARSFTAG